MASVNDEDLLKNDNDPDAEVSGFLLKAKNYPSENAAGFRPIKEKDSQENPTGLVGMGEKNLEEVSGFLLKAKNYPSENAAGFRPIKEKDSQENPTGLVGMGEKNLEETTADTLGMEEKSSGKSAIGIPGSESFGPCGSNPQSLLSDDESDSSTSDDDSSSDESIDSLRFADSPPCRPPLRYLVTERIKAMRRKYPFFYFDRENSPSPPLPYTQNTRVGEESEDPRPHFLRRLDNLPGWTELSDVEVPRPLNSLSQQAYDYMNSYNPKTDYGDFLSTYEPITSKTDLPAFFGSKIMFYMCHVPIRMPHWEKKEDKIFCSKPRRTNYTLTNVIDRFYHFRYTHLFDNTPVLEDEYEFTSYVMYFRTQWLGHTHYVYFKYSTVGSKDMYVTKDPEVYLKSIIPAGRGFRPGTMVAQLVRESMIKDGIDVEEPMEFDQLPKYQWKKVAPLGFLCHMTIYENSLRILDSENSFRLESTYPSKILQAVHRFNQIRSAFDDFRYNY